MAGEAPALGSRLLQEQVKALYSQAPATNLMIVFAAVLFFLVLRQRVAMEFFGVWALAMFVMAAARIALWYVHRRYEKYRSQRFWLLAYSGLSGLVGVCWGTAQLFMGDFSDLVVVVALLLLIFGVMSSAVSIFSFYLPAFFGYCIPQVAMLTTAFLLQWDGFFAVLAFTALIYFTLLTLFARNAHSQFVEGLELLHENENLVSLLNEENAQREGIIRQRTQALKDTNRLLLEHFAFHHIQQLAHLQYGVCGLNGGSDEGQPHRNNLLSNHCLSF